MLLIAVVLNLYTQKQAEQIRIADDEHDIDQLLEEAT
jgi:hypothetical protein